MPPPTPTQSLSPSPSRRQFGYFIVTLAAILAAFFGRSFIPGQMVFANDGPLGLMVAFTGYFFSAFLGHWSDLNWVGGALPASVPDVSQLLYCLLASPWLRPEGTAIFGKFFAPAALLFLGGSAWALFRTLKFRPAVCVIAGLAAALHSDPFSNACWGLPPWAICHGTAFLALAAVISAQTDRYGIIKLILAGAATGMGIMEAYDTGAIFSLMIGAFTVFMSLSAGKLTVTAAAKSGLKLALVAGFAAVMATAALSTLIGTQIQGIAGMSQDKETKQKRWHDATQFSLPKAETLRVVVAGLYGYRMDTPAGGNYWGAVGQDPENQTGRGSGSGEYAGVLVALLAAWAAVQSFRKTGSPFAAGEKRCIWFFLGAGGLSLLLAWGRHAPFYQFFYALPYASTMRNPIKFMQLFSVAIGILFAFGLEGLARLYATPVSPGKKTGPQAPRKSWWQNLPAFDRKCVVCLVAFSTLCAIAFLGYAFAQEAMVKHLTAIGFDADTALNIFKFSAREAGWALLFLGLACVLMVAIASGALAGKHARWVWLCLGIATLTDLARANAPWIQYYDYPYRYASNPILERLREKPYEQRVYMLPFIVNRQMELMNILYRTEWNQHLFPYNRIQTLDVTQEPRSTWDNVLFRRGFSQTNVALLPRLWELTNTRYLIGLSGDFIAALQNQLDPGSNRFRLVTPFNVVPKRTPATTYMDYTAVEKEGGPFALIEFTGALPRASLYSQWQVITNPIETIDRLAQSSFDPHRTVLVDQNCAATPAPTNLAAGTVTFAAYEPKHLTLEAKAEAPAVLLLNDKHDVNWKVWVDGQPRPLLRCNLIMRGVFLSPGSHRVEFRYQPPVSGLYVSLAAIIISLALAGFLAFHRAPETSRRPG